MAARTVILTGMSVRGKDSTHVAVRGFYCAEGLELTDDLAQRLIGTMHEGVLVFDQDAKATFANARAIEIVGIPFSELVNQRGADARFQPVLEDGRVLPWDERPTAVALRTGEHCGMTVGVPKPDGMTWVILNAEPLLRDGEGTPYGVITVFTDITEHTVAEMALTRSEELKSAIMAASLDAILTLTRDLIALRKHDGLLQGAYSAVDAPQGVWAFRREGGAYVALNLGSALVRIDGVEGEIAIGTDRARDGEQVTGVLELRPREGVVIAHAPSDTVSP